MRIHFYNTDEGCTGSTHTIKQRYHLRHGGHFDPHSGKITEDGSYGNGCKNQRQIADTHYSTSRAVGRFVNQNGSKYRQTHAESGKQITPLGCVGSRQHFEANYKRQTTDEVANFEDIAKGHYFFFLNIWSIRLVTTNPPTTFSVPNTTARNPRICAG